MKTGGHKIQISGPTNYVVNGLKNFCLINVFSTLEHPVYEPAEG